MPDPTPGALPPEIATFDRLPNDARVKASTICTLLSWSRRTLYRRVSEGVFPAPIREACNVIRWRVGDVRKHLAGDGAA